MLNKLISGGKSLLEKTIGVDMGLVSREALDASSYYTKSAKTLGDVSGVSESNILSVFKGEKTLADVGLADSSAGKVMNKLQKNFREGSMSTQPAIQAMYRNVEDTGELYAGISRAQETQGRALGFNALGNPENIIGSALVGAALGGGASSITGGDVTTGAMIGGAVGGAGAVGAKIFRAGMQDLEESVMKKALGNEFKTKDMILQEGVYGSTHMPFTRINDEISLGRKGKIIDTQSTMGQKVLNDATFTKNQTSSARSQNLEAISAQDFKPAAELNMAESFALNRMKDTEKASMGVQSRFATMGGAMLAGVAFSGKAGGDKRSGFNKNRGNRF
jgi:hypothetical protein